MSDRQRLEELRALRAAAQFGGNTATLSQTAPVGASVPSQRERLEQLRGRKAAADRGKGQGGGHDFGRHKRNVKKLIDAGAPEQDIEAYLSGEGVTAEMMRDAPTGGPWEKYQKQDVPAEGPWNKYAKPDGDSPTATNPKTGERLELRDGKWEPLSSGEVKTATNPTTGEKLHFIDGKWQKPKQPKLNDRIAGGLRDFADSNVFPDGIAETALDGVTKGAAALIDNPVGALKTVGKTLIADPLKSIATAPANLASAVGTAGLAAQSAYEGDTASAKAFAGQSLDYTTKTATGVLEAATLGQGGKALTPLRVAKPQAPVSQIKQDFARSNVDPSIATIANNTAPAHAAQQVSENLLAGGAARRNSTKQIGQAEARKDVIADNLDLGADTSVVGETVLKGVKAHREQAGKLYDSAYKDINLDALAPRSNQTLAKINGELRKFDNNTLQVMFEPGQLKKIKSALEGGGDISIRDLRQLRTEVRLAKSKPKINATQDDAALIRIEKSLTDDLFSAIEATSGKRQAGRLRAADNYYAKTQSRVQNALKPFVKFDQTNEGAFDAIRTAMQGQTTSRGRGNLKQLVELKKAISTDDLKTVQAGIFKGLGRTTEGASFSPQQFASQWDKFGTAQKNVIFGQGPARKDMDALVNVMKRLERLPKAANHSKSGVSLNNAATFAGVVNPLTFKFTAIGLGAGNVTGRVLTNPRYVKALRGVADAEYAVAITKHSAGSLARLTVAKRRAIAAVGAIEAGDDALRGELDEIKAALNDKNSPAQQGRLKGR